jgi:hypothetical protein
MMRNYTWVGMFVFYVDGELVPGFGLLGLLGASWIEEVADSIQAVAFRSQGHRSGLFQEVC